MKTINQRIYDKLMRLAPELWSLEQGDTLKSKAADHMGLNLDVLNKTEKYLIIAMSRYYKHKSGDMIMPDSEMTIKVTQNGSAEVLTYRDWFIYQEVYLNDDKFNPTFKRELNNFLNDVWLKNCIEQGHFLKMIIKKIKT